MSRVLAVVICVWGVSALTAVRALADCDPSTSSLPLAEKSISDAVKIADTVSQSNPYEISSERLSGFIDHARKVSPAALARTQGLIRVIHEASNQDEQTRVKALNLFFNRQIKYAEDSDTWKQVDYWASVQELLDKGQGDCEDYATAKYFALLAAGVSPSKLRISYVRATLKGQKFAHMVLAYFPSPDKDPLILDNLVSEIKPASERSDLEPVFNFGLDGLWAEFGSISVGDPLARIPPWSNFLDKVKAEGWLRAEGTP